ncbi:MAG TPA: hypothetical protein VJS17_01860, partial [Pyrinomonadaceae bacterium]|nr:hypothetical protein [Pyrinomonadaceae bacterium]
MAFVDLNKPGEKKKVIWAGVLGLVALIFLWWTFVGFGSSTPRPQRPAATASPQRAAAGQPAGDTPRANDTPSQAVADLTRYQEIIYQPASYNAPEPKRNIFAYYEPPKAPPPTPKIEPPSPTPTPPLLLASISPSNAYARAADFPL